MVEYHHFCYRKIIKMAKETYNHSYKELVNLISEDLGYKKEDKFNTFIVKQLQKIRNEYSDEVILETVKNEGWKIKNKIFDTQNHKISYFFVIIKNNVSFYNRIYNEKKAFNEKMKLQNENNFVDGEIISIVNEKTKINNDRDISSILEDF